MPLYDTIGLNYAKLRQPDPRIASAILHALSDADSIANIGAGAGSYEPPHRTRVAIEPSQTMIRQRPPGAAPCIQATAENLPLESRSIDAALAVLTLHHWSDLERGLREMARIARKRIVILTWVPDSPPFWLTRDYFPEIYDYDTTIFPSSTALASLLASIAAPPRITPIPIPHDCIDGFLCAYWKRPHAYLDPKARAAISSFARINAEPGLAKLRADLESSRWNERNAALLPLESADFGYRIVTCELPQ